MLNILLFPVNSGHLLHFLELWYNLWFLSWKEVVSYYCFGHNHVNIPKFSARMCKVPEMTDALVKIVITLGITGPEKGVGLWAMRALRPEDWWDMVFNTKTQGFWWSDAISLFISASRERRPPVPDKLDNSANTKRPCGRRHKKRSFVRPRIVGGSSSLPGSHPWTAAIYIGDSFCGGSLVQTCWVVSAAHCFANR